MRARLVCVGVGGLLAMLAAARAHADWREGPTLNRPPTHILDVWDAGTYSVGYEQGSNRGAYLVMDGGVVRDVSGGPSRGTFYRPAGDCFVSLSADGTRPTKGADGGECGGINRNNPINYNGYPVERVKHTPEGSSAMLVTNLGDQTMLVFNQGIGEPTVNYTPVWSNNYGLLPGPPYAVAQLGSSVHFVLGVENDSPGVPLAMWVSTPGNLEKRWPDSSSAVGDIRAVALFATGDPSVPRMVVATRDRLFQDTPNQPGDRSSAQVKRLDPGQEFVDVAMSVGTGSTAGEGFGMALVKLPGGGVQVLSPVPAESRARAGTTWLERPVPATLAPKLMGVSQVACHGAAFCAFSAPGKALNHLFVYSNDHRPELALDGGTGVPVDAGGDAGWVELAETSTTTLSLGADDLDGDPVRVTAVLDDLRPGAWDAGVQPQDAGEPVRVLVNTNKVCVPTRVGRFDVRASDGWQAHDLQKDVDVYVKHTRPPLPPRVNLANGLPAPLTGVLEAGDDELTLTPVLDQLTSDQCHWKPSVLWTQGESNGPTLTPRGTTAILRPPDTFCEAAGRDFQFTLEATDEGNLSVPQTFTFRLRPWGRPERVFAAATSSQPVVVAARASARLEPATPQHACQTASGFPGVVTSWTVKGPGGGAAGDGYLIQSTEGGPELQNQSTVEARGLVLSARDCQPESTLTVSAEQRVMGAGGARTSLGPESQRQVRFLSGRTELSLGRLTVAPASEPGALLLDSTQLNCVSQRGLGAVLRLAPEEPGGSERTQPQRVSLPALWTPPRDVVCGSYALNATLKDDSGSGPEQFITRLELPGPGVRLEQDTPVGLKAVCGQGVNVALSELARPTPGFCQSPEYSWAQRKGPGIEKTRAADGTETLTSVSQEFDALIGQEVEGDVEASKGGERARLSVKTRITTEPFIRIERTTELPAASETGLVGVLVRLTNTTACDVSGVLYTERLEGLSFVRDSARLDGEFVKARKPAEEPEEGSGDEAEEEPEGEFEVTLPRLEAGATRTLSYVARPHLLGERRMEGEARKNKVVLSRSDTDGPPSRPGCGCSSAGAAPLLLVLAVLGGVPRRRRATARS